VLYEKGIAIIILILLGREGVLNDYLGSEVK
jgi:hypothetical protein